MILKKVLLVFLISMSFGCGSEEADPAHPLKGLKGPSSDASGKADPGVQSRFFVIPEDSKEARSDFLNQKTFSCVQNKGTHYVDSYVCDLGVNRGNWNGGMLPKAPIFAAYADAYSLVKAHVRFPEAFFHKLPVALQNQIKKDGPDQLEISWVIQDYSFKRFFPKPKTFSANQRMLREREIEPKHQLKAHYWACPDRDFWGNDPDFQRSYQMMIFDPQDSVGGQLNTQTPVSVEVSIHDRNRISPPGVGEVDFSVLTNVGRTSLWSYVLDDGAPKGERRAVATLHWLVSDGDLQGVEDLMKDSVVQPKTLEKIYEELKKKRTFVAKLPGRIYGPSGDEDDFDNQELDFQMTLDLTRLLPSLERLIFD